MGRDLSHVDLYFYLFYFFLNLEDGNSSMVTSDEGKQVTYNIKTTNENSV